MPKFAPRMHVLLAQKAPLGLVIRRGPSKCVATILWDRQRDEFQLGQWLRGRIYERRSDLSPDGKHFIYFAMNGKWPSKTGGSWTAISRAPYLKALVLLAKGDCWHGGGLWTGNAAYWLNDGYGHTVLRGSKPFRRDKKNRPKENYGGECLGVYYPRLLRDGWRLVESLEIRRHKHQDIFEKPLANGWTLRKFAHAESDRPVGKGCYWDEHALVRDSDGATIAKPDWEWADVDGKRLVWAAEGKLNGALVTKEGLADERMLHDFNDMKFEAIKAPYS